MNIVFWNVRGLCSCAKKKGVARIIKKKLVEMVLIQESKMSTVNLKVMKQIWSGSLAEFKFCPALGLFGGLLLTWNPSFFVSSSVHKGSS